MRMRTSERRIVPEKVSETAAALLKIQELDAWLKEYGAIPGTIGGYVITDRSGLRSIHVELKNPSTLVGMVGYEGVQVHKAPYRDPDLPCELRAMVDGFLLSSPCTPDYADEVVAFGAKDSRELMR